jgi:predicted anti-sigma-YlaC factor YlaD
MPVLEIDCFEVWRNISDLIDDEVTPDLRQRIEEHFKACAHCKAIFDGANNVVKIVGDERAFDLPPTLGKKLYAKFEKEIKK